MNRANSIKKQLEYLMNLEDNLYCFDCAHWASVNNAVFLCLDCSGDHRGLGVSISYIRSVTLDSWNENQVSLLKTGGNVRLRDFLKYYDIPKTCPRKQLYSSKIFNYYRKLLKAAANNELSTQEIPDKREMLDPFTAENDGNLNKMMINISKDHYTKNYSSVDSSGSQSQGDKFTSIGSSYKNDSRFASVSSAPFNPDDEVEVPETTSGSSLYNFLGSALWKTKDIVCNVKDKMYDMDLGSKIIYGGGVTVEAIKYTGSKVYEKGSDIVQSDTFQNIKERASGGLQYVIGRIFNKGGENNTENTNSYRGNKNYTSYSSSDYKEENEDAGSYVKMNDNKKENLLDDEYKKY